MAEHMTRDEHVAKIRELLEDAKVIGNLDAGEFLAAAAVEALIGVGDQLAALVEHLANPRTVVEPAPLWVPVSQHRYERDGGVWALEYRSPLIDDDPDAGWWLYGPTCGTGIRFGSCGPALAQQRADLHIGEMVPARRRHRFDWWVKTSARDAFTCEAHGTVWFLVRNPAEAGPEPRPQRWRVYAVDGSAEMFLDRAPEDDEDAAKFAAEAEIRRRFGDDTAQDEVPF